MTMSLGGFPLDVCFGIAAPPVRKSPAGPELPSRAVADPPQTSRQKKRSAFIRNGPETAYFPESRRP